MRHDELIPEEKLLVYTKNSIEPRTDPRGTTIEEVTHRENDGAFLTQMELSRRKSTIQTETNC